MGIRNVAPLMIAGVAAACAHAAQQSPTVFPSEPITSMSSAPSATEGRAVFDAICSTCHSVNPPATNAPPMSHVARHYRTGLDGDRNAVAERIAAWIMGPDPERSLLPAHATERWGVMPVLGLVPEQARAVAGYVASLGEAGQGEMTGRGMTMRNGRMGQGQGMMEHHGQGGMGQGQGMMHHGQGGMSQGQGMMMHHGQGGMSQGQGMMMQHHHGMVHADSMAARPMGEMCPMHRMRPDTGSTTTR